MIVLITKTSYPGPKTIFTTSAGFVGCSSVSAHKGTTAVGDGTTRSRKSSVTNTRYIVQSLLTRSMVATLRRVVTKGRGAAGTRPASYTVALPINTGAIVAVTVVAVARPNT